MAKQNRLAAAQALATDLLNDPHYLERLKLRLLAGELPPAMEAMLFHYAFGKPVESIEVTDARDIERMTDAELLEAEQALRARMVPSVN